MFLLQLVVTRLWGATVDVAAMMLFRGLLLFHSFTCLWNSIDAASHNTLTPDASANWQKYVRSPPNRIVSPARIVASYTQGNVTNPEGLLTGKGSTIFTRKSSDVVPTVVVDFGQNIAGFLSISFGGASNSNPGSPGIRLAFSETLEYLTNTSDFSRSYNVRC
jgi:hypothetical protein